MNIIFSYCSNSWLFYKDIQIPITNKYIADIMIIATVIITISIIINNAQLSKKKLHNKWKDELSLKQVVRCVIQNINHIKGSSDMFVVQDRHIAKM